MIIDNVLKKKNKYIIHIEDEEYEIDEDVLVEYNIYKGKEIDSITLVNILKSEEINKYYNMALSYYYKYMKSSREIYLYLINKEVEKSNAMLIINKLKEKNILDDSKSIKSHIYSYIISYNGINMIREKLKAKGYESLLIEEEIKNIDYDLYYESLNKVFEKTKEKYKKESNDYLRKNKIKAYLFNRGYTYSDINELDI